MKVERLRVGPVSGLAYEELRRLLVGGHLPRGSRLGQGELADQLGISRTSVREALNRLASEGLVESRPNRGFFAAEVGLATLRRRLEVRLLLEPPVARLAAARRTEADLAAMRAAVAAERAASATRAAHEASKGFHLALARATGNDEIVRAVHALWSLDSGDWLVARRRSVASWQGRDADEHEAIAEAVARREAARAEELVRQHVQEAIEHWSRQEPLSDQGG